MIEVEEIANPECDSERWWALAKDHPLEAMSSPLFSLLTLESPGRWEILQKENIDRWIRDAMLQLPSSDREQYAAECAERVLYVYDLAYPGATLIREAVDARRRRAKGRISEEAYRRIANVAYRAARDAYAEGRQVPLSRASVFNNAAYAAYAASDEATYVPRWVVNISIIDEDNERLWQWRKILQYREGKI